MILRGKGARAWSSVIMRDVRRSGWGDCESQQQKRWLSLSNCGAVTQQAETWVLPAALVPEAEWLDKDVCQGEPRNALHAVPLHLLSPLQQLAKGACVIAHDGQPPASSTWALHSQSGWTVPHLRLAISSISSSTMMLHSPIAASTTTATSTL